MSQPTPETKTLILSKRANHEWKSDGFCKDCINVHRTDFRPNDLCSAKIENWYLDYVNNFLSLQTWADHYDFSDEMSQAIVDYLKF
jgi:hypothetical protein